MDKKVITREEALARFRAGQAKKRECIASLERKMKEEFEKRTCQKATHFSVM